MAMNHSKHYFLYFHYRAIAPSLFGNVYSWSLTNIKGNPSNQHPKGFPFNQYFAFFMMSLVMLANVIAISRLPKSLNRSKIVFEDKLDEPDDRNGQRKTISVTMSLIKP